MVKKKNDSEIHRAYMGNSCYWAKSSYIDPKP